MISREDILQLHNNSSEHVNISLYIPTHRSNPEAQQDRIRYKNMMKDLEERLNVENIDDRLKDDLLNKASSLLEDNLFWQHNNHGLAVFVNDKIMEVFKIPFTVSERLQVAANFLITPLIRLISLEGTFSVLALSQKNVRLLKCSRTSVEEVPLEKAPTSMDEFRKFDVYQESVQHHSGQGSGEAIFHGQGGDDDESTLLTEYFKSIENEVTEILRKVNDPLILAGADKNIAHYRKVNHYDRIMDSEISTNPDPLKNEELKDKGWELIESYFLKDMLKNLERFESESDKDKVSENLEEIVKGAYFGKVSAMFITNDTSEHGKFDAEENQLMLSNIDHEGFEDVVNLAALKTLDQGGEVYVISQEHMPVNSTIAALYRYV